MADIIIRKPSSVGVSITRPATRTINVTPSTGGGGGCPDDYAKEEHLQWLNQFFGIEGAYEAEAKGGERTNNTVIDECKVRFQDAFNGLLPTGFTMPNSVTVDNVTYTGTTNS